MNVLHSALDSLRDKWAPITHTSTFRSTGQITPDDFLLAGDYLVYKFPTWSWSSASSPARRVSYLPAEKQFLVTRGVPCHRRLDDNFAMFGDAGAEEAVVKDGFATAEGAKGGDDDGWLRTGGGMGASGEARAREVRTVDEMGEVGEREEEEEEEEEIPDMEDEEDDEEAIIRDPKGGQGGTTAPLRTYTLYITYTPYYRTPRLYLSGYLSPSEPLPPAQMLDDIVGDYKDKTVTLEDFPFFDPGVKMASIHPCKHASVMKILLDRADAALKIRLQKMRRAGAEAKVESGMEGLVDGVGGLGLGARGVAAPGGVGADEWEVLQHEGGGEEEEVAIRVDQYLVVFMKFAATVVPTVEYDYTMGV